MKNEFIEKDGYVYVKIFHKNKILYTVVDIDDFNKVNFIKGTWHAVKRGNNWYAKTSINKKTTYLHQLVYGEFKKGYHIDHINRISLDNRRKNLRLVLPNENLQNMRKCKETVSNLRNVYFNKRKNKWYVQITLNRKKRFYGYFDDINKANDVAKEARKKYMPFFYEGGI